MPKNGWDISGDRQMNVDTMKKQKIKRAIYKWYK